MELGELISLYRKQAGLTIDELAASSGVSKGAINKIISGETKAPTLDKMKALAKSLGKTLNDFMDEAESDRPEFSAEEYVHIKKYRVLDTHGRKVVDHVLDDEYDRMTHIESREEKGRITYISLYDLAASAGTGEPLGTTYYTTKIEIPTEQVPEDAHCCLRVNGDSMEPAYKDGDIVFIQRLEESVREGEIGVFSLNGEGYMKRLGRKDLESLNPKYPPIPIREFDDLRCFGRVLGKVNK